MCMYCMYVCIARSEISNHNPIFWKLSSKTLAKGAASLKCIKLLHEGGELNDWLVTNGSKASEKSEKMEAVASKGTTDILYPTSITLFHMHTYIYNDCYIYIHTCMHTFLNCFYSNSTNNTYIFFLIHTFIHTHKYMEYYLSRTSCKHAYIHTYLQAVRIANQERVRRQRKVPRLIY